MKKLLTLDLSTTCTGYAVFDLDTRKLLHYGTIKPSMKGLRGAEYPLGQLKKMRDLSDQIKTLLKDQVADKILIEEINPSKNRLGQKTLDGFHFILVDRIESELPKVSYIDSDGSSGWRVILNLRLSEQDKLENKNAKAYNNRLPRGSKKRSVVNKKTLACRYVNKACGLNFDVDKNTQDADICDAIGMGLAYLKNLHG